MRQNTDVSIVNENEIECGSSGELQSAVYTLCRKGMMKYWNIEPDILHGQQAFISAESLLCNEARVSPPMVQWRQEHKKDRPAPSLVSLVCVVRRSAGALWRWVHFQGLAVDIVDEGKATVLHADETFMLIAGWVSFQNGNIFLIIIYSWLWSNPLISLIPSLDISPPQPKHDQTRCYCSGLSCVFGYTTPVHPRALTSSHQVWIW